MTMNDKERYEYAEDLVALARENPNGVQPQDLVDLIEKKGEVSNPEDAAAILNLAAEIIYNEQRQDTEQEEAPDQTEDCTDADDALEEAAAAGHLDA